THPRHVRLLALEVLQLHADRLLHARKTLVQIDRRCHRMSPPGFRTVRIPWNRPWRVRGERDHLAQPRHAPERQPSPDSLDCRLPVESIHESLNGMVTLDGMDLDIATGVVK